jgi:hypothetical protein
MGNFFDPKNVLQVIISVIFVVYLIVGYHTPPAIASFVDTIYGKIIVVAIALIVFLQCHPILGILGFIVAFDLIVRSSMVSKVQITNQSGNSEMDKANQMNQFNDENQNPIRYPNTLEQDVIRTMAPLVNSNAPISANATSFSPVTNNLYDAAPVNFQGII